MLFNSRALSILVVAGPLLAAARPFDQLLSRQIDVRTNSEVVRSVIERETPLLLSHVVKMSDDLTSEPFLSIAGAPPGGGGALAPAPPDTGAGQNHPALLLPSHAYDFWRTSATGPPAGAGPPALAGNGTAPAPPPKKLKGPAGELLFVDGSTGSAVLSTLLQVPTARSRLHRPRSLRALLQVRILVADSAHHSTHSEMLHREWNRTCRSTKEAQGASWR